MAEHAGKPRGSPALLILVVVALVPALLAGSLLGAGPASIIGAFVALFSLVVASGGPLRADLRILAGFAPLLLVAAVLPRLLGGISRVAAFAVIVVLVLVAALQPLRGPRFVPAGLGLGMLTLLAYGIPIAGAVERGQLLVAAVAGLGVALVLRLLMGAADPSKPTRERVAALLADRDAALTPALDTWLSDGCPRWLGEVLASAARYRLATDAAEATGRAFTGPAREAANTAVEHLWSQAGRVAEVVRQKDVPHEGMEPVTGPGDAPAEIAAFVDDAAGALADAEHAARHRDGSGVPLAGRLRGRSRDALRHPTARWRSVQIRHALRTALGVLLALLVTTRLAPGDPLVPTVLMTTFGIVQTSWRGTLAKAWPRIAGLVVGALAVLVIVLVVPPALMTPVALVALAIGLWNLTARPALGNAAMVCMSVGINSSLRHLDPVGTLVEYIVLTAAAVAIGLGVGFVVIPALRAPPLRRRIDDAFGATLTDLRALAELREGRRPDLRLRRDAAAARRELTPDRERLTDDQLAELDRLRAGLADFDVLGTAAALGPQATRTSLERVLDRLECETGNAPDDRPRSSGDVTNRDSTLAAVAEQVSSARRSLLDSLPGPARQEA